jgi:hypothetical protein
MSKEGITWEEAHKALGVKLGAPIYVVRKAWIMLSKKYHPDLGGSMQDQLRINEAYAVIKGGRTASKNGLSFRDYRKEYLQLKKMVSDELAKRTRRYEVALRKSRAGTLSKKDEAIVKAGPPTFVGALQDVEIALVKKNREDQDAMAKIDLARKTLAETDELMDYFRSQFIGRVRAAQRRALLTNEQRTLYELQRLQQELEFLSGVEDFKKGVHERLRKLKARAKIIRGKVHIPFLDKVDGEKVAKYVFVTSSILAGIIAGSIIYDKRKKSFTKALVPYKGGRK